jgi:hypothetical protein
MSFYTPIASQIIPQGIADTSTTQLLSLGSKVLAYDVADTQYGQGTFIYAKGVASTVVGSVVAFSPDDWSTALATTSSKGSLGVSMSINPASSFGWYQIAGKAVVKALTGFADGADCYLTTTAGSIDDAVTANNYITGMLGASAVGTPSTGLAEAEISNPSALSGSSQSINKVQDVLQIVSAGTTTEIDSDMEGYLIDVSGTLSQTLNFSVPSLPNASTPYRSFYIMNSCTAGNLTIQFDTSEVLVMLPLTSLELFLSGNGTTYWDNYTSSAFTTGTGTDAVLSLSPTIRTLSLQSRRKRASLVTLKRRFSNTNSDDTSSSFALTTDDTPTHTYVASYFRNWSH